MRTFLLLARGDKSKKYSPKQKRKTAPREESGFLKALAPGGRYKEQERIMPELEGEEGLRPQHYPKFEQHVPVAFLSCQFWGEISNMLTDQTCG